MYQLSVDEVNRQREGDKLVYQLSVDEGNRRRERDNLLDDVSSISPSSEC